MAIPCLILLSWRLGKWRLQETSKDGGENGVKTEESSEKSMKSSQKATKTIDLARNQRRFASELIK